MKKTIVILDDDPHLLLALVSYLEAEGYGVLGFSDFESLLQELHRSRPDVVITDVVMPDITGFEACRRIKEMFQPHPPHVIMMTGKMNDAIDPLTAREMGADDFVIKTADVGALLQAVRKILSDAG